MGRKKATNGDSYGRQKLWEGVGCLVGPEGQHERLRKAMFSSRQLREPYERHVPEEMREEFARFVASVPCGAAIDCLELEEMDSRARQILGLHAGFHRHL